MRPNANTRLARALRQSANAPEQIAWDAFRSFRKRGFPVRRQHPIGRYIVDFAVVSERIVIEIDGGVHQRADVAARDAMREQNLREAGWRVLRIPAEMAMSPDHLIALLERELGL